MVRELTATGTRGVEDITNAAIWNGVSKEKEATTHTDNYGAGCGAGCGAACGA
ncbi:hypothetical protein H5410_025389 [Solanum commersonii]|uniref:Uncharacterized protein n=1 Tax=Solanum commersonii TaxID=4109 RepID=A0A9J5YTM2_SOLCO|nr:hypothetical protein H5410_025389 [Solanum commersonii]